MTSRAYIGTSGWNYRHWKAHFYAGVPQKDWLRHAGARFSGLEINASFYRLQKPETLRQWAEQTPDGLRFALKANRYLTHNKKLKDPVEPIARERENSQPLGQRLGAVLWQLPANLHKNMRRLQGFGEALQQSWSGVPQVVEFRDRSWFTDDVADCLAAYNAAVCISDAADWPLWDRVTADLVYVRLHGHTRTYYSAYSASALDHWAERVRQWLSEGRDVHVYFDNDVEGAAPRDALGLIERTSEHR